MLFSLEASLNFDVCDDNQLQFPKRLGGTGFSLWQSQFKFPQTQAGITISVF
jgi:hypothetical protein